MKQNCKEMKKEYKKKEFDLYKNQYTETELIKHIFDDGVSLKKILCTQKHLSATFCMKYLIFNDEYSNGVEDSYIDVNDVLKYQKHLNINDFDFDDEQ